MPKGYLSLILHAHLPFVRHPEHKEFLEEDWFFEAVTGTYLPLLEILDNLHKDGVSSGIALSLSPSLISMLCDPLLQERYRTHLDRSTGLALREMKRTRHEPEFHKLARLYHSRFSRSSKLFSEYKGDLVSAFKKFQDLGMIEIITCPATHALLPFLAENPSAMKAQVAIAAQQYRKVFNREPGGFWLPECAYAVGVDQVLKEFGIRYFFLETHGVLNGNPRPKFGVFAPVRCPSGVYAFGRDTDSSRQVWSRGSGYPGDPDYRDFYRDIGFDLDTDDIHPHVQWDGNRKFTGIKYFKITGKGPKEVYNPEAAGKKAAEHAGHFWESRKKQVGKIFDQIKREPILVFPFDAELFGHWWFEGPEWLDLLLRKAGDEKNVLEFITPGAYLERHSRIQRSAPSPSSWGEGGYFEVWLNRETDWIYKPLLRAADRMSDMAATHKKKQGLTKRALNQAARELLLAQSSDWAFMIRMNTSADYAKKRIRDHLERFNRICDEVESDRVDARRLHEIEACDNIFPDLDFRVYC